MGSAVLHLHSLWLFSPSVRGLHGACCNSRSCLDHFPVPPEARTGRLSHTSTALRQSVLPAFFARLSSFLFPDTDYMLKWASPVLQPQGMI